jgi:ribosomal protein L29
MARADGSHSAGVGIPKIFRCVCASRALVASIMCLHVAPTFQSSTHLPPPPPGCAGLEAGAGVFARGPMRLRGGKSGGLKAREMWAKPLEDLGQMEEELRVELMSLRVAKQVGGQPGRVNQIRNVRKSIARVLTVQTAKRRADAYERIKKDKYKPLDARPNR